MFFLEFLILAVSLYLGLRFIYFLQIKEYRYDRFLQFIKEKGIGDLVFSERVLLIPKKSIRNRNIALIMIVGQLIVVALIPRDFSVVLLISVYFFVVLGSYYTGKISKRKRAEVIELAKTKVAASGAIFIGVTGSFGKSTVKEFLYHILSQKFNTGKTIENYNTDIGVALSINKNLTKDTEIFIVEMGAYKKGEIKAMAEYILPKYSILTGLGNQHLALFGSLTNLVESKGELLSYTKEGGLSYLSQSAVDFSDGSILEFAHAKVKSYSLKGNSDINLSTFNFNLESFAPHQQENLLPCISLALDLGLSDTEIEDAIRTLEILSGKLSLAKGMRNSTLVMDHYSSNIDGFLAALDFLDAQQGKRKLVITKGLLELGKELEPSYASIASKISEYDFDLLTTDKKLFSSCNSPKALLFGSEKKMLKHLHPILNSGTALLIEGRFTDKFIKELT